MLRATGSAPDAIDDMPGGASTRRYLRVRGPFGVLVAMFVPDAAPEEATSPSAARVRAGRSSRCATSSRRAASGCRASSARTCDDGLVLLEDLGDDTLGAFLDARTRRGARPLYARAVARSRPRPAGPRQARRPGSIVASRAFDATLLRWEFEHFREWALEARGKDALRPTSAPLFDGSPQRLAHAHRRAGRAASSTATTSRATSWSSRGDDGARARRWIDFQDALLGPRVYDLVALLNDSYQTFDRAFVEARLDEYARAARPRRARARRPRPRVRSRDRAAQAQGRGALRLHRSREEEHPAFLPFSSPDRQGAASLARLEGDPVVRAIARAVERL